MGGTPPNRHRTDDVASRAWRLFLRRPTLRHFSQFAEIVALGRQRGEDALVVGGGNLGGARHDPHVVAFVSPDHGLRVVGIEVRDQKLGLERPEELHVPRRIIYRVHDEAAGIVAFGGTVETPLVKGKHGIDRAVRLEAVGFNAVVRLGFDKSRDRGDDIPRAHEARQIDAFDGLERGSRSGASGQKDDPAQAGEKDQF